METPLRLRNVLLRAFFINWAAVVVVWLLWLSGVLTPLMRIVAGFDAHVSQTYLLWLIGIWKILGVVLFLVPAIAIHWEYKSRPRQP
jgi:hypothetical protein